MQIDKLIGQRVRALRQHKGLTMADLAHSLSVPIDHMQDYETGARRILPSQLWLIADCLGVSVVRLFQDDPSGDQNSKDVEDMLEQFDLLPATSKTRVLMQMRALSSPEMNPLPPPANKRPL